MTCREDRQTLVAEITTACATGARLAPACRLAGIDLRTFERWRAGEGEVRADRRPEAVRPKPAHALSETERARIIELANGPRFASTPPARIVPTRASMSPAKPASIACCATMARCSAAAEPAHRGAQGRPARMWPPARGRSGVGMSPS
jgi:hypothetical protein